MSELENITADQIIDARGTSCPGPILEAKKGISKVKVGQILEIRASDPATKDDLPVWVKRVGHEYLGTLEGEGFFSIVTSPCGGMICKLEKRRLVTRRRYKK